jgi:hypothetical protein
VRSAIHASPYTNIGAIAADFRKLHWGGQRLILSVEKNGNRALPASDSERQCLGKGSLTLVSQQPPQTFHAFFS